MSEEQTQHGEQAAYPTVFREFLYADIERARSLLAQRLGGVPEEERATDSTLRRVSAGFQQYLGVGRETKIETYEQRSLLDALFPALEELLDAEQWLVDISDVFNGVGESSGIDLSIEVQPGSIVRLTATGQLFDAAYIAEVLGGAAAVAGGMANLAAETAQGSTPPPRPKGQRGKPASTSPRSTSVGDATQLEDLIGEFPPQVFEGLTPDQFRGMVKLARGLFLKGLHLHLQPHSSSPWTATARLQGNRHYLDAEPDVLFSRYGTAPLEWTVVGVIGHYASQPGSSSFPDLDTSTPGMSRTQFVSAINTFLGLVANAGLADSPQYPGFSIIPLAVYRIIPRGTARFV